MTLLRVRKPQESKKVWWNNKIAIEVNGKRDFILNCLVRIRKTGFGTNMQKRIPEKNKLL